MSFFLFKKKIKVTGATPGNYTLFIPVHMPNTSTPVNPGQEDTVTTNYAEFKERWGVPGDPNPFMWNAPSDLEANVMPLATGAGIPTANMINGTNIFVGGNVFDFGNDHKWNIVDSGGGITIQFLVNNVLYAHSNYIGTNAICGWVSKIFSNSKCECDIKTFPWYDADHNGLCVLSMNIKSQNHAFSTFEKMGVGYNMHYATGDSGKSLAEWFEGLQPDPPPDPDPNAEKWGNSTPGGGKGTREGDSGKIVNPYAPDVDALDAGFLTAFLPTVSQLNDLATYLWSNPISFESLEKLISNPFDLIIGLHMLPISIASAGTKAIKPGALTSGISAAYTDKQIITKDFGTLDIEERWGSVLDYAPYTKIQIHLPYIGTRTLDTDEVMGKTIGLKYKVDILSGACVAEIAVNGSVMYEFAGNMALDIPITAQDHRQLLATLATIGVTAAGAGLAALGGAGAVAGAGAAASEAAGATGITAATVAQVGNAAVGVVMASKPTIERAGGLGSAAGWCGVQTPYILIESPEQSLPKNYMSFNGYPCNMSFTLSSLTGYTQCETVRFGSAHATDPEMQEVIASLQAGVVLGGDAPTKPSDPLEGIGVTLYQNASPALYVYKNITAYGAQHVCNFKQPTDVVNPTITLELSAIDFNYVYIGGSVDRFYYVVEKRSVRRGVWEIELKCDPLMSFATDILATSAVVSRQENEWNLYLDDGSFKAYQYTNFYQEPFATSFDSETYVLIVAGS